MWEHPCPWNRLACQCRLLALLLVPMTAMSMAPEQSWVSISGADDVPASINDLVVDAKGNTYVAGEAAYGFVTQKFGPDGVRLWSVAGDVRSSASALTLTSDGGVAATGHSNYYQGYYTVKYSSEGHLLWSRHFTADERQPQSATAIAATADGGVVVTGRSKIGVNQDAHTIRYTSDGQVLWEQRYQIAAGYNDEAFDVVVAVDGSIVVVGRGSPVFPWGVSKWFVVKYSDDGVMQWERIAPETSGASALAVTDDGGVVVTGYRRSTYRDYYTIKYSSDGQIEWEQSYDSPSGGDDYASAVAVADDGSVVVTGTAENFESGNSDYVTIKYSSDGQLEWDRLYAGPGKGVDSAHAIAVASNGDVVVTGTSENANQRADYYTIRYSGDGQVQWEQRYDGPSNRNDAAYAVAVASDGSLRVGGIQAGLVTDDFGLIRYEAGGGQTWVATEGTAPEGAVPWGAARFGRELLVDSSGNTFFAGSASEGFLTQKIGPDGSVIWSISYNGAPESLACSGPYKDHLLAATGDGGVVVTGWLLKYIDELGICGTEYYTVKYSSEGRVLWERHGENRQGVPVAVIATGDDGIIVTGNSIDAHTIKYSGDGDVVWELNESSHSERVAMVETIDGGVVVTGTGRHDSGYNFCTVKYSADGQKEWEQHFDGSVEDRPYAMTATSDGGVVVVGYSWTPVFGSHVDFYTIKYSSDGQVMWEQRLDGSDHENDRAHAVAESADGGIVVTGYSINADMNADFLTVRYSADGQLQWQRRFDGLGGGWSKSGDVAYGLTATSDGGVVVTGYSVTEEDEGDYYTIKYSGAGEVEWEHRLDGLGQSKDSAFAVAVAPDGSLRIGGNMGNYIGVVKLEESSVFANGFEGGSQNLEPAHW